MTSHQEDKRKNKQKKKPPLQANDETAEITDPQEDMEGPVSSIIQNIKESAEDNDNESKEEADKKKDKNT